MAITFPNTVDPTAKFQPAETKVINGQAVTYSDLVVHSFMMSDVDDPEIYAAQPLWEWEQSEQGQWVMEHAIEVPWFSMQTDLATYSYRCIVVARMSQQDQTFFKLKWK